MLGAPSVCPPYITPTFADFQPTHFASISQFYLPSVIRFDPGAGQFPVFPPEVHRVTASCTQTLDLTVRPRLRQRRQQLNLARVRLQEHFTNPGHATEVTINLKRWMRIEE